MTAPAPGRRITVRVDDVLSDDLSTLAGAGLGTSDAVRQALALLADTCRSAWDHGVVDEGVLPTVTAVTLEPSDGSRQAV